MEAHPVPQNVTSFEFRLVGDMTLKQFIYLATGVGLAYLLFVTIAAKYPFVAWPLIVIFSLLGVAYAFVPIQDRPLDHWTGAFLKAIYAPTKRLWRKNGKDLTSDLIFKNRLNIYLSAAMAPAPHPTLFAPSPTAAQPISIPAQALHPINPAPTQPLHPLPKEVVAPPPPPPPAPPTPSVTPPAPVPPPPTEQRVFTPLPQPVVSLPAQPTSPPAVADLPSAKELTKTVELGKQAQTLQLRIIETERQLTQIKKKAGEGKDNPSQLTNQFNQIFENLQKLTEEASSVKQQLSSFNKQPAAAAATPIKIEVVPHSKPVQTQIVLTTFPNVINGIVSDNTGNYLEAAVVVIHDKDGLPVRALKSNKLGQFTGSTPLLNGVYTIEVEKDGFAFDVLKIELDGKVLPPLVITAKGTPPAQS